VLDLLLSVVTISHTMHGSEAERITPEQKLISSYFYGHLPAKICEFCHNRKRKQKRFCDGGKKRN
jgi:hypothetical protein